MKYLLDTNTCIRYINGRAPQIREHMRTIAAVANGLIVVTHNIKEFGRIAGLKIEDWEV